MNFRWIREYSRISHFSVHNFGVHTHTPLHISLTIWNQVLCHTYSSGCSLSCFPPRLFPYHSLIVERFYWNVMNKLPSICYFSGTLACHIRSITFSCTKKNDQFPVRVWFFFFFNSSRKCRNCRIALMKWYNNKQRVTTTTNRSTMSTSVNYCLLNMINDDLLKQLKYDVVAMMYDASFAISLVLVRCRRMDSDRRWQT